MNKLDLVKRNTEEIITENELSKLFSGKKKVKAYIGYAPTGRLHVGYSIPLTKIADLVEAGVDFTFMIADLHAHIDDRKSPWELLDARSKLYEIGLKALLKSLGANVSKIKFVRGSDFQKDSDYFIPVLRMAAETTLARAKRAASEVVRFGNTPNVSSFLYPLMQTWDVAALDIDIALGGIDQRGIYMLSREILPTLDKKKPVCIFTPLLPGLSCGKMSASVGESKIDLLDSPLDIRKKAKRAYCPAGSKKDNGVLMFFELVIFPWLERKKKNLDIKRPEQFGGNITYKTYADLEKDYLAEKLHPMDLKSAFADLLSEILEPVRKECSKHEALIKKAYS